MWSTVSILESHALYSSHFYLFGADLFWFSDRKSRTVVTESIAVSQMLNRDFMFHVVWESWNSTANSSHILKTWLQSLLTVFRHVRNLYLGRWNTSSAKIRRNNHTRSSSETMRNDRMRVDRSVTVKTVDQHRKNLRKNHPCSESTTDTVCQASPTHLAVLYD